MTDNLIWSADTQIFARFKRDCALYVLSTRAPDIYFEKVPSLTPKKSTFVWKLRLPVLVFRGTVTRLLLEQITQISVLVPFLDSKRIQIPGKFRDSFKFLLPERPTNNHDGEEIQQE